MGILVTLIVFMITRKDRYAEFLAVASLVCGDVFQLACRSWLNER